MAIAHDFVYEQPTTLEDALALLAAPGRTVQVLAGGTDLIPWLRDDMAAPDVVVDIKRIADLSGVEAGDGGIRIGALATLSDVLSAPVVIDRFPLLVEMAHLFASVGIRNRATLVGNICSAVPSCDAGPVLLVSDAAVHTVGRHGARVTPITEWFTGPRLTTRRPDELVTHLVLPDPGSRAGAFAKLSRYTGEDLAQASVAVLATPDRRYRVAFGAVAPAPFRAEPIEHVLEGHPVDDARIAAAVALVPAVVSPITDLRATREYRVRMCGVMLERALRATAARAAGAGPPFPARLM